MSESLISTGPSARRAKLSLPKKKELVLPAGLQKQTVEKKYTEKPPTLPVPDHVKDLELPSVVFDSEGVPSLEDQKRIQEAYVENCKKLFLDPDNPEWLSDRFTFLSLEQRSKSQLAIARRCYNAAPDNFVAVFNYASALSRNGYESLNMYRRAIEICPPDKVPMALHHLGVALHDAGDYASALQCYEKAHALDPTNRTINQSVAIAKLAMGRLAEGLYEFEVMYLAKPHKAISKSGIPWWNGESLEGKSVILTHDQGFGDTLHFIRFAPKLKQLCGRLVFSGSEPIAPLIAENFDDCFDDVINEVGPFEADYVVTPMGAAALMGINYPDVTGEPYLRADPAHLPPRGKLKVGISWKGSKAYRNDALRSSTLDEFAPLFDLPGAAFYSLQVKPAPTEITTLGLDGFIVDIGSTLGDWRSTAAAVAALDVVVCTDSAIAHLAGALGKPVLLVLGKNPCWRWGAIDSTTTPWYKSMKLFRQVVVDHWPMLAVRDELEKMIAERG